jgi:uncharacterized protein (TIGR00251 family)
VTVHAVAGGVRFSVRVQPRASRSEICGVHGEALKIRLGAPPADGAANEALVVLLAHELAVPKRAIRIVSGASSRSKLVQVDGIATDLVEQLASRTAKP